MGKRIAIASIGTDGDVRPYVALAKALQARGHSVVISTTSDFEDLISGNDVEFHRLGDDIRSFLSDPQFDAAMSRNIILHAPPLLARGHKIMEEAAAQTWRVAQDADAIIFNINTNFAIDLAEAADIPAIMTAFQPLNKTKEFPFFGIDRQSLDPTLNELSWVLQAAQQMYYDFPRNRLRETLLGLKPRKHSGFAKDNLGDSLPTLYAYSPTISPRPRDWPRSTIVTGFWNLEGSTDWTPDPALRAFLDAGDPPVYLGFGSMPWRSERNTEIVLEGLRLWGGRAIIGKGWGGVDPAALPETIFVVDRAPHSELFKHVRAVAHHGGAGTTHTGLLAGRPTFVIAQFFDQPYWGRRVHALGCGPKPVRVKELKPRLLADRLSDLMGRPSYATAARAVAEKLRAENGPLRAVEVIEGVIASYPRATASQAKSDRAEIAS